MSVLVMRAAHALGNAYLLHHIIFPILEKDSLEMVSGEIICNRRCMLCIHNISIDLSHIYLVSAKSYNDSLIWIQVI